MAALVARRGPGRPAPLLRRSAARPAAAAAAAVLPAARAGGTAQAAGGWGWEAEQPRTQAVAKFPRRAHQRARLPATRERSERGREIFNLVETPNPFPLSSSVRAASGRSCKLGHGGCVARGPGFEEARDSGARAPRGPGAASGCERVSVRGER